MNIFERIANEKIKEAMDNGEFDDLPGKGKPLNLEDESGIPEDMRLVVHIMKNAGVSPPEVSLRKELENLRAEIARARNEEQRRTLEREARWLCLKIAMMHKR